ncbi:hypothetical protein ACHAPE_007745 [Trichoderma viride]
MLDNARQRQLEYDLHAISPRLKKYQREERRRQPWQLNAVRKGEVPLGDRREPDALIEGEQTPVRPETSTSKKAANISSLAFSFESLFSTKPTTTAVVANNIAAATTDSEIKNFFSFCGEVTSFEVTTRDETKSALITFENEAAVKTALFLNNTQVGPNDIKVTSFTSDVLDTEQHTKIWDKDDWFEWPPHLPQDKKTAKEAKASEPAGSQRQSKARDFAEWFSVRGMTAGPSNFPERKYARTRVSREIKTNASSLPQRQIRPAIGSHSRI